MFEDPKLHLIRFPPPPEEEQTERERQRDEGRRRYHDHLTAVLAEIGAPADQRGAWADAIIDRLLVHRYKDGHECHCSCHPRLPETDFHDFGSRCPCRLSPEERAASWAAWEAERDAYWASPEGRAAKAARQAEEDELLSWMVDHEDVVITSHGGWAPEQWDGSVEGHRFYFRERHDQWRIELDLRPTGQLSNVWRDGPLDDDASFEPVEIESGDVIAEGTTGDAGYGQRPVERAGFIVGIIREHLERQRCEVHRSERPDLECLFGRPLHWCPACGERL